MRRFLLFLLGSVLVISAAVSAMQPATSGAQARVSQPTQYGTGKNFACALSDAGTVKCWGYNGFGQLGNEALSYLGIPGESDGTALPIVDLGSQVLGLQRKWTIGARLDHHHRR